MHLLPGQKGRNRLSLARNLIQDLDDFAGENGLKSRFKFAVIPGKGHSMVGLLQYSKEALLLE